MIRLLQLFIFILLFLLVIFIFYKIKNIPNSMSHKFQYSRENVLKKYKHELHLKNSIWSFLSPLDQLKVGEIYNLIELINESEKCFLGKFYLRKYDENGVYFRSEKKLGISKLEIFSKAYNKTLQVKIFSSNYIFVDYLSLEDCNNWVKY